MTRVQRRRHLVIWTVLGPLLVAMVAAAAWMNPARGPASADAADATEDAR